jgi:S-adenosylmethionine:tRNA ribosyltransferase-isomerase
VSDAGAYPTSAFDYDLPDALIARHPAPARDESRLLVVDRATSSLQHRRFRDVIDYVAPGDALVLNETKVIPARLLGVRASGAPAEVLLLQPAGGDDEQRARARAGARAHLGEGELYEPDEASAASASAPASASGSASASAFACDTDAPPPLPHTWIALVRPGAKLKPGRRITIADDFSIEVLDVRRDGTRIVELVTPLPVRDALEKHGHIPLPPYIDRPDEQSDRERYQTVFARTEGSVAAPTAGLHFTPALLDGLRARGVRVVPLVLHVGAGTFRPVDVEDPARHTLHEERYALADTAAAEINAARAAGGRIWAVGTTVTRTLETLAQPDGTVAAGNGWTRLFIRPGFEFRVVDRLITNFHLPRSTLLMLVAAFGGYERIMQAYATAVAERYRFYSYGDAMAVL